MMLPNKTWLQKYLLVLLIKSSSADTAMKIKCAATWGPALNLKYLQNARK